MSAEVATRFDESDEAALLDAIDRWVERDLRPIVKEYDHADRYPAHIVEQMKELGLFGAAIGAQYGGLGLPAKTYARLVMRISSVWMSITGIFNSHLMLALAVEKFGTPEQKAEWLPKLASGEIRGGLALTEADAGTDLQAIRMTARRDGSHYVIDGTKTWITNGVEGSCVALLVKTDPNAQPRHKGMSLFIAPKMQGFTVGKKLDKLGYKAVDSAELVFENYRVPAEYLIGGVEGQGFYQVTGGSSSAASTSRRAASASPRARCSSRRSTRRRARRSASRSASTRRSSSSSRRWPRVRARRACSRSTRPPRSTAASAAISKPGWRNTFRPRRRSRTASSRCGFMALTATRRSTTSSDSIATRRSP
jgi:alkylation response protein AidB-like acyl-CoA dehydrogenase